MNSRGLKVVLLFWLFFLCVVAFGGLFVFFVTAGHSGVLIGLTMLPTLVGVSYFIYQEEAE